MFSHYAKSAWLSLPVHSRHQLAMNVFNRAQHTKKILPVTNQLFWLNQQWNFSVLSHSAQCCKTVTTCSSTPNLKWLKQNKNHTFYNFSHKKLFSNSNKPEKEDIDDLQSILKDRSLGITAKFKLLFKQYGVVLMGVHVATSAVWISIFYMALSRGIDIIPFLENIGVFDFLERIGFSYADKLKSSSASIWLMTYLLYELAKPIRYGVTLAGTVYAVRYLRKIGRFKPPPKSATVGQLMDTQRKIIRHRINKTSGQYRERYGRKVNGQTKKVNGQVKVNGQTKKVNGQKRKRNGQSIKDSHAND